MKAFVTGASGFIGGHLIEALSLRSWKVRGFDLRIPRVIPEGVEIVQGDIANFEDVKKAMSGSNVVFHLASALGGSIIPEEEFFRINATGTETVLRAVRDLGVEKTVHFSSAGVLGAVKDRDVADETYLPAPRTVYDRTKLKGEECALRFSREGLSVVIVRPGWVYGPGDKRTLKVIKAISKKRFFLVAGGKGRQTPVFVKDLAEGAILCAVNGRPGEIYNIGGSKIMTVREMCEDIACALGIRLPRIGLPALPAKTAAAVMETLFSPFKKEAPLTRGKLSFFLHSKPLSISKAREELGYAPQTDFPVGMAETVEWYRKAGWLS